MPGRTTLFLPGPFLTEALAEKVGHLDEEGAAVAAQAGLELAGEGIESVTIHIVVITKVKSGPGIWRSTKKKFTLNVCTDRVEIDSAARDDETTELIRR